MTLSIARVITVMLLLGGVATSAGAADPPGVVAKHHFDEGVKYFNIGDFNRAAEEYLSAYKAVPDNAILYNIAQSYRLGNDFQHALFFYKSYLRNVPDAHNRGEVEERIHKLEVEIQQQKAMQNAPPTTTLRPSIEGSVPFGPELPPAETRPAAATVTERAPERPKPLYKQWWLWTAVGGVVVVGVALGVGLGVGLRTSDPTAHFGVRPVF